MGTRRGSCVLALGVAACLGASAAVVPAVPTGTSRPATVVLGVRHQAPDTRTDADRPATGAEMRQRTGTPAAVVPGTGPTPTTVPAPAPAPGLAGMGGPAWAGAAPLGIPAPVLAAYERAERVSARRAPACGLSWALLAGVGQVESGHASGGRVDRRGRTRGHILGPRLDGSTAGTRVVTDTDGGRWDGDAAFDRAAGPMQFLPGTWAAYGRDGNGDGVADPHNVVDAAQAAAAYLCASGADLRTAEGRIRALMRYNASAAYGRVVVAWAELYAVGAFAVDPLDGRVTTAPVTPALAPPEAAVEAAAVSPRTRTTGPAAATGSATSPAPTVVSGPESSGSGPTGTVTPDPTATGTPDPTATGTPDPTVTGTPDPTVTGTPDPTVTGTPDPTEAPTEDPTEDPTEAPIDDPTDAP